jgi:uncharacterized protein YndB with AHSA1/START domain
MIEVSAHAYISAPREDLYDFVADLGARPAWCDHFMDDFRLAHPDAQGEGAGARFQLDEPGWRHYEEVTIITAERPRLIVERMHGGRNLKTKGEIVWELTREAGGNTRVEVTFRREAGTPREAFKEKFGSQRFLRRQFKAALERLRVVFEEGSGGPLARASIAGYESLRAPRFGASPRIVRG